MNTQTPNLEAMKEEMKQALTRKKNQAFPSIVSALIELLDGAQQALRESDYPTAVLELRQGLQTNYGLRYTVYLRDVAATFENPLFSVFVGADHHAFQAEGNIERDLPVDVIVAKVRDYLLQPHVVDLMTGLLYQFGHRKTVPILDTPVTT